MKNGLLQKFVASVVLSGVLAAFILIVFAPSLALAAPIDLSKTGTRSIEGAVDSLGTKRCSMVGALLTVEFDCIILNVVWVIDKFLAGTLLNAATGIFDASVKANLANIAGSDFVTTGWGIVRDIANLFFIFILLWIALATIFDIPGYGAKDVLRQLIIAALLINFSLAIGGFVINFTNALAGAFLRGIPGSQSCFLENNLSCGISNKLLGFANIQKQTLTELDTTDPVKTCKDNVLSTAPELKNGLDPDAGTRGLLKQCESNPNLPAGRDQNINKAITNAIYQALWLIIVIPILSFVFFAGAIFFLVRYLMLSVLLVFAPIVFLFRVLPATQSHWNTWWDRLISWSFFAPAFLFLLFLTVTTFEKLAVLNVLAAADKGFTAIGFDMILLIVLMIMNLLVAQKMGIYGADTVTKWGKGATGWAQGAAKRGAIRGAIRGAEPAAKAFTESRVGQFLAGTPGLRALTQPAVAIQKQREELDKERANKVLGAVRTAPPEFAAQRLAGESRSVQEAVYNSAKPEDIERIMKGFTRPIKDVEGNPVPVKDAEGNPVKDAAGNPVIEMDKSAAEKEIIKIRNRDPKLAERIENSVKDIHLKVVAAKGVGLGSLSEGERAILKGESAEPPTPAMAKFQQATNEYLNDQSEQKLKTILTPENIKAEQVENYMLDNFGAREAKALSRNTDQLRAFTETMMKAVEKKNPTAFRTQMQDYKERHRAETGTELSDARARFLTFRDMARRSVQNPTLKTWISSAPALNMMYRGVPLREREFPGLAGGGGTPPPAEGPAAGGGTPTGGAA